MKNTLVLLLIFITSHLNAGIKPENLKCEYLNNPEGIDMPDPRFYWQLKSGEEGQFQTAYQILVATSQEKLDQNFGDAFDSKKIKSNQNTHVVYKGKKLDPAANYFWKVKVWDKKGKASEWSETATFSSGLFSDDDWKNAQWIAWKTQEEWETKWWKRKEIEQKCLETSLPAYFGARMSLWERYFFHSENPYDPAPLFRKEFSLEKEVKSAKAFVCGIGYHELYINGKKVGDHVLDPAWTNYKKTAFYVAHDVTDYVKKGLNAVGVMLGRGNYGSLAIDHWGFWKKGGYIGQPKLKCLIKITYTDGSEKFVNSDLSWKVTGGPVLYDDPHMGEIYDATLEIPGWNTPGLDDSSWNKVQAAMLPGVALKAQLCEPIRVTGKTKPVDLQIRGWRKEIWGDAGTNMAGWIRLKVNAPKGTQIVIYYGEDENVMDASQAGGLQQMAYVAKGEPGEIAECRFSYKGFRYFLIKGHTNPVTKDDIEICQVNSDVDPVGDFTCSSDIINGIHKMSKKAMISNLHSIPTDCPHREKNGWMGDAVTGIEMGMGNFNMAAIITKFIGDIYDGQDDKTGGLATIAPDNSYSKGRSPLWGSAGVHLPWYMYNYYGDTRIIEKYWDNMKAYVQSVWLLNEDKNKLGIFTDVLSDWATPTGNQSDDGDEVYATMNFYLVLQRMATMGKVIGKKQDVVDLQHQAKKVNEAIHRYCFDREQIRFKGLDSTGYRQGPNALALQYGIVKPEHYDSILSGLIYDIKVERKHHIYGGIFTGLALWELLPNTGNAQLAFDVAVNENFPGYAFMLKNGATTLWEHWEDRPSRNHYFHGYVDNFFYRHLAGITYDNSMSGFKKIVFQPKFVEGINSAKASYNSIHGEIKAGWVRDSNGVVEYIVSIPANCEAEVVLPQGKKVLKSGNHKFSIAK